ncbi:NAD(P)/FAD-dependent oxidoreductase [Microbacterium sp. NPDC055903]
MYDVIVIGAGPAGLQAALTLGRMHRTTMVLDSGEYRNGPVAHMHNMIGADGMPPAEFRATARAQLAAYADVELRAASATSVEGEIDDFAVTLADGRVERSRRVLLATGVADELPPVPGLDALWGVRAFTCPFCDGHEFHGAHIGILGATPRTAHLLALLGPIVGEVTVFPLGDTAPEDIAAIQARGTRVHPASVVSVADGQGGVAVETDAGTVQVAGLFVAAGTMRQRAPFAAQLGLRMLDSGAVEVDEFGRTSVRGISAAGDLAHRATLPGPMAAVVLASAAGMAAAAGFVQELSA